MPQTKTRRALPARWLWSRKDYYRMAAMGLFREQRVELIEGVIIQMPAMREPHAAGIEKTRLALEAAFGPKCWARAQMPLHLRRRSAPEPDVAVVLGRPGDFQTAPTAAATLL